jgi:hypothetical protein
VKKKKKKKETFVKSVKKYIPVGPQRKRKERGTKKKGRGNKV